MSYISPSSCKSGFTLVELSIVLVILGLLVGGVLSGQSLIHAAELRKVSTDFSKHQTAFNAFRDKYFALPGDMATATSFWGSAGGTGADSTCFFTVGTGTQTCNGNGNGLIVSDDNTVFEHARVWQHLANAGLIEGAYDGGYAYGATPYASGTVAPRAPLNNAYYSIINDGYTAGRNYQAVLSGNAYMSGRLYTLAQGVLTHPDAWNLDKKMDDGVSAAGAVRGLYPYGACTTYDLANTTDFCALLQVF